jgi:hypothetical protein
MPGLILENKVRGEGLLGLASPLLEFGREREGVDLSKIKLTHHGLKNQGKRNLPLMDGEKGLLRPLTDTGSGAVQEKEKTLLSEIISRVNDLFEGDLTDDDGLIYVNNVLKGSSLRARRWSSKPPTTRRSSSPRLLTSRKSCSTPSWTPLKLTPP